MSNFIFPHRTHYASPNILRNGIKIAAMMKPNENDSIHEFIDSATAICMLLDCALVACPTIKGNIVPVMSDAIRNGADVRTYSVSFIPSSNKDMPNTMVGVDTAILASLSNCMSEYARHSMHPLCECWRSDLCHATNSVGITHVTMMTAIIIAKRWLRSVLMESAARPSIEIVVAIVAYSAAFAHATLLSVFVDGGF